MKTPRKTHHMVLTYIEATQEELECKMENQKTTKPLSNLTKGKRTTLQKLSERDNIVIINAEKGGGQSHNVRKRQR